MKEIKMKLLFGIIVAGLIFSVSCSDSFINRSYQDQPSPNNFLVDKEDAKQLVVASYQPWTRQRNMYRKELPMLGDMMTDDSDSRLKGDRLIARNWGFQPSTGVVEDWWNYPYQSVNAANYAIENIPALLDQGVTQETLDPYIAEARFIRGFDYLFLVIFYGQVPLITKPLSSFDEYSQPKASLESIYDQIISDFTFAKKKLLGKGEAKAGTPTKATAAAYLAKVYLYKEDYENAETAAREAINIAQQEGYHLVADYTSIFDIDNEQNPELLFYISYIRGSSEFGQTMSVERNTREIPNELSQIQGGGWGYALPTRDLYDAYEEGDPRRGYTLYAPGDFFGIYNRTEPFTYTYHTYNENGELVAKTTTYQPGDTVRYHQEWSPTGLNVRKLTENLNGLSDFNNAGLDVPVMRMADLYLILAEALAEQADAEALKWVNKIRARPSVNLPPKTQSDGSLIDIVRHERRVELAMEGQRIWDLMRWKTVKDVYGDGTKVKNHFFYDYLSASNSRRYLDPTTGLSKYPSDETFLPIPQAEIDRNSAISNNNPGF